MELMNTNYTTTRKRTVKPLISDTFKRRYAMYRLKTT